MAAFGKKVYMRRALTIILICLNIVFISKAPHVLEFFTLGFLPAARKPGVWFMLFSALAVAVTDETIQLFTGRASQVKDVVIDFAGALAGMATAGGVAAIIMLFKKRNV